MKTCSPFIQNYNSTRLVMLTVILATIPGILVITYFFGWGTLIQISIAVPTALLTEAFILYLRKINISSCLPDLSAILTAILLAISLPPLLPAGLTCLATILAISIAKHLYGGLGSNPFNPAMFAYIVLLVSFPLPMTTCWILPKSLSVNSLSFIETIGVIFSNSQEIIDSWGSATPLDLIKTELKKNLSQQVIINQQELITNWGGVGWQWVNISFLISGLILMKRKIISWHIPVGMIIGIGIVTFIARIIEIENTNLIFHYLSGGTMLGAFFIATDPVSAATSLKAKIYFGLGVGVLTAIIRIFGSYPDAIAFSVLLMNIAAPILDKINKPKTYGIK